MGQYRYVSSTVRLNMARINAFAQGKWYKPWLKGGAYEDKVRKNYAKFLKRLIESLGIAHNCLIALPLHKEFLIVCITLDYSYVVSFNRWCL